MYINRCIYILTLLGLTACGGGGGDSASEQKTVDTAPVVTTPQVPSAQTFDLTGQSGLTLATPQKVAGTQSESNSTVSTSFSNALGTIRYPNTTSIAEGNLTFGVTASDTDVMNKVSLYLPNTARSLVLCADNCTPDFQATITGFNPQLSDEVAGSLRIELVVEDSLGNSAVVDAFSVNWQPIQISALSASRENGLITVSWSGNSKLERYNLYATTEVGVTSENATELENGIQQLAINGTTAQFNDVDESKNYHLLVTGIDNGGESGKSAPFSLAKLTGVTNLPPVANNDSYQVNEDETITVNMLDNDFDPEGLPLIIESILLAPINGTLTRDDEGNFTYVPRLNFHGTDSASYRVMDAEGATAEATVVFEILPINDNPVAIDDAYGVDASGNISAVDTNLLSNDSDIDGDNLSITTTPITPPQSGTLSINADGSFSYQSFGVLVENDQFVYQVTDGQGGTAEARVTILPNGDVLPPLALNDNYTVDEDSTLVVSAINLGILANDSDPNDLSFELQELLLIQPQHGLLNLALDGTFTYIPNSNFFGVDQFQYQIKNSAGLNAQAFVTITINPTADIPVALDDNYQVQEDIQLIVEVSNGLLINDTNIDNSSLRVNTTPVSAPQNGSLTLADDGSFSYLPESDFNGVDSFTYQVISGTGLTNTANVNISVIPLNDAPVAVNDLASTNEDTPITVDVLANDMDSEGDFLTILSVSLENGTAAIVDNKLNITPALNFFGEITATYSMTDSINGPSSGSLVLTVLPVNDAPIAVNDRYSLAEDAVLRVLPSSNNHLLSNDSDVDGDTLTVSTTPVASATRSSFRINTTPLSDVNNGNLTLNSDGSFTYIPNLNFNGVDSFIYQIKDGNGGTAEASVTIAVTALNDVPEIIVSKVFTILEDGNLIKLVGDADNLLSGATDADGDNLSINTTPVSTVTNGSLTLSANGAFSYIPSLNFNGADSFTYEVIDGNGGSTQGTVTLTVSAVNDLPIAVADAYSINEDIVLNISATDANNLLKNDIDVDGDTLSVSLISGTSNGLLSLNSNGAFSYTPDLNFSTADSFVYQVSDGNGGTAQATVTLTVNAVNDLPVAVDDSYSFAEDFTWVRAVTDGDQLLSNDTDADGDVLTVNTTPVTGVSNGALTLNSDGSFTYIPDANFFSQDSFTYEISDGQGGTAQASVTLIVHAVNDIPVVVNNTKSFTFDEDNTLSKLATDDNNLLTGASDVDGDNLTVTFVPGVTNNGSLTVNNDGSFQYTPNLNVNGIDADTFTYQVSDGNGGVSETVTVSLNIQAVNDAPTPDVSSYTFSITELATDGDLVGTISASDIEGDTLLYTLTSGDTSLFEIDSATGIISVKGAFPLDFETNQVHTLTATITDDGSPIAESADVNVSINVLDILGDAAITEEANFGRTAFGSLELGTFLEEQALLTDSVIVAGAIYFLGTVDNDDKDVYIISYNQDGTLNTTFGDSGIKTFDFGENEYGRAIIHDTQSFYIAFNSDDGTYTEACFLKVNNSGDFVTAFGNNGLSCTSEQKKFSINDIMYDDFDILAVGKVKGTDDDTLIIQISEDTGVFFDHTIDPTTTHLIQDVSGLGLDDEAIAVHRPFNFKNMITGNVVTADGDSDIFAWELDGDGDPVATFNNDGSPKFYDITGSNDEVHAIGGLKANNFTVYLAGSTVLGNGAKDALILSIDKTGSLNAAFGINGTAIYDADGDAGAGAGFAEFSGIVANGSELYVSGTLFNDKNMPFATRIFADDGAIDTANYGIEGFQQISYATGNAFALSMSLDNGKGMWIPGYVEVGSSKTMTITAFDSSGDRYNTNDIVDGKNTLTRSSVYTDDSAVEIIQIQSGAQVGNYLTASIADDATNQHIMLTRLTSAGLLDTTFDIDGHKELKIGTSAAVQGMFELSSGNFIIYGNVTEVSKTNGFIARIDQNGLLDISFGDNGIYTTSAITSTNIKFNHVKVDSLNRLIAVGNVESSNISAFVLRLTNNGELDTLFNTGANSGYIVGANTDDSLTVEIDASDNIFAGGNRDTGDKDMLVVKYLSTGLLDNEQTIDMSPSYDDSVQKLIFDTNNDLLWIGSGSAFLSPITLKVVKTSLSGELVTSFSGDGKASYNMSILGDTVVKDALIDGNNNIIVAGYGEILGNSGYLIGRIKASGDIDTSFDDNGYYIELNCSSSASVESIILLNNSSFVVAGQCYQGATEKNNINISHYKLN